MEPIRYAVPGLFTLSQDATRRSQNEKKRHYSVKPVNALLVRKQREKHRSEKIFESRNKGGQIKLATLHTVQKF